MTPAAPGRSGLGCYIHVPFCSRRCDYCAFSTFTDRGHLVEDYVAACCAHLGRVRADAPAFETVYLGGGTPSLLAPRLLVALLEAAGASAAREVTIECNPESTSPATLEAARDAGATRISLGVQSVVARVLAGLGRHHEPGSVAAALGAIRDVGFERYSVDLVLGGAGERDEDLAESLATVFALAPGLSHVSCYALTVEQGTPLARDPSRHPDEDVLADRYEIADEFLGRAGLRWYEISNWAVPGHECAHNLSCWSAGEYVAIGSAAHGHLGGRRYANVATPERYIARVGANRSPVARTFVQGGEERRLEALELSLRTRAGVPLGALAPDDPALDGLVERVGDRLVLTRRGRLLENEVAIRLLPGAATQSPPPSVAVAGR